MTLHDLIAEAHARGFLVNSIAEWPANRYTPGAIAGDGWAANLLDVAASKIGPFARGRTPEEALKAALDAAPKPEAPAVEDIFG